MAVITLPKDVADMGGDEFKILPAGTYEGSIERVDLGQTSKRDPMFKVLWKTEQGYVYDNVSVNAEFKVKQYMKLLGIENGNTFDTDDLLGVEAIIEVTNSNYTNPNTQETRPVANIKRITPMA